MDNLEALLPDREDEMEKKDKLNIDRGTLMENKDNIPKEKRSAGKSSSIDLTKAAKDEVAVTATLTGKEF